MPNINPQDIEKEVADAERSPIFQMLNSIVGNSPAGRAALIIGAIIVVIAGVVIGGKTLGGSGSSTSNGPNVAATSAPGNSTGGGSGASGPTLKGLPAASFKQTPKEITFDGCPPQGDGGDPVLNNNKNRVDVGSFQPVAFDTIEKLSWPPAIERKPHADWSAADAATIAQAEGLPVQVEAYLAEAKQEGPETPNCHSATDFDFHIWMLGAPGGSADRANAVVIEATPRVRANHPQWTVTALNKIAKANTKIRVSGWILMDPEHPDQVGKTRGTIWEIHPVIDFEVFQSGKWIKLDDYSG